jgi:hypothetical protein
VKSRSIQYLNTDLELISTRELTSLAKGLTRRGMFALRVDQEPDGLWSAWFETNDEFENPESTICAMLETIESLPAAAGAVWKACRTREFNIGYDCGDKPWPFNNQITSNTLKRVAKAGASIRITIYPREGGGRRTSQKQHH